MKNKFIKIKYKTSLHEGVTKCEVLNITPTLLEVRLFSPKQSKDSGKKIYLCRQKTTDSFQNLSQGVEYTYSQ